MSQELKEWFVPWLMTAREYNTSILDKAWAQPDHARLMLNENPIQPSEKIIEAIADAARHGNWYPDSFKALRTKIGQMYDLGPDNVALCNGSSETIDAMMRIFLTPGDEFILSNPTFELFPPRAELCGGKVVQIPVLEDDGFWLTECAAILRYLGTVAFVDKRPANPFAHLVSIGRSANNDITLAVVPVVPVCREDGYQEIGWMPRPVIACANTRGAPMVTRRATTPITLNCSSPLALKPFFILLFSPDPRRICAAAAGSAR